MAFKISKAKEYATIYLNDIVGMSEEDISSEIQLSVDSVKSILESRPKKSQEDKKSDSFIHETSDKKTRNIAIMTKEASIVADDLLKKSNAKPTSRNRVFKPRG